MSARAALEGPFSRAVREALESVASEEQARRLLAMALSAASRSTVPEDAPPFAAFVEGPLRAVIVQSIGLSEYDVVAQRLAHVVKMANSIVSKRPDISSSNPPTWDDDSSVRVTGAPPPPAEPRYPESTPRPIRRETAQPMPAVPPPAKVPNDAMRLGRVARPTRDRLDVREEGSGSNDIERILGTGVPRKTPTGEQPVPAAPRPALVLVLSLDPVFAADTEARAKGRSRVTSISSMHELLDAVARGKEPIAIVIDTALPSIDVPTVAALASSFPKGTTVVLWGMTEKQKERLVSVFPVSATWIASGAAASPDEILFPAG
jgi:hypothetical protein